MSLSEGDILEVDADAGIDHEQQGRRPVLVVSVDALQAALGKDFRELHSALLAAAQSDLPVSPIREPLALIDRARAESGADRWAQLLPVTPVLAAQYFPERRIHLAARLQQEPST